MKKMRALINWLKTEDGGRRRPPTGDTRTPYSTVVRFAEQQWPSSSVWSLVVEKVRAIDQYTWEADIHFLVPEAPEEFLSTGNRFELYEGKKRVASGTIEASALKPR